MAKPGNTGLSWRQVWFELLNGRKIKRPTWKGYWIWENNTIMMYCADGNILDIRETTNPAYTFTNIASNDWEILPDNYEYKPYASPNKKKEKEDVDKAVSEWLNSSIDSSATANCTIDKESMFGDY